MNLVVAQARVCDSTSFDVLWTITNLFATIPGIRDYEDQRSLRSRSDLQQLLGKDERAIQIVSTCRSSSPKSKPAIIINFDKSWLIPKVSSFVDAMDIRRDGYLLLIEYK